jgi:hypothetical protein
MPMPKLPKATAFLGVLIAGVLASSPAYADLSYSQIRALHSGKCVDVPSNSMSNGAPVQQWDCLGSGQFSQHWALFRVESTTIPPYFELVSRHSGKCLDVTGASIGNGALVQQWGCLGSTQANQQVSLFPVGTSGYYRLVFRHSGKCLDVTDASTANGARLQQWECLASQANQEFAIQTIT